MKDVYLVSYSRSAFTRAHPYKPEVDSFADISGDLLLTQLINQQLEASSFTGEDVDDLSIGCALQVKEQWNFGGRYPILLSQLGDQCASRGIEQQCGSGLAALRYSALNIASGSADIAMAAGYEHMTRVPMGPSLFEQGILAVPDVAHYNDSYDMDIVLNMGLTAENLAAKKCITKEQMDTFAEASHRKASLAREEGFFQGEIVPLMNMDKLEVSEDTCIRKETTVEKLSQLKPAFKENGLITAGNSSSLSTGAALIVLMSEEALIKTGMKPLARIVSIADRGTKPELMGQGVIPAVEKALAVAGLTASDIDFWEINEAFSVVPLCAQQYFSINDEQLNVKGGALALGHPLGASGIRLAGTLARILISKESRYGCAAACIGGGQGIAMIIECV
ncbi:MAG: acetyl-CoA acyltransferase [Alteromonadaceae bacterium]|jgi:acetyl-CoA acyltransferase